ncbi:MAG: FkbM family methyltransferase [Balneolaceae bacterium]
MSLTFTRSHFFQQRVHPVLSKFSLYSCWLLKRKSYLKTSGWFRSFRSGKSVDADGNAIPWFTYGAIEILKDRLPDDALVFEYGCGLGTHWWAKNAKRVISVEHEKAWIEKMSAGLPGNAEILYKESGKSYTDAITKTGKLFDVVIIDGRNRVECCKASIPFISERGILIFDDTGRQKYMDGIRMLKNNGFRQLAFKGFSPIEFMECETSIFYRDGNLLGL